MSTFTRILLNPASRGGRKLLTQPQAMHAAIRGAFPPDIDQSETRVLWRVDRQDHAWSVLIVGPEEPDTRVLIDQGGWPTRPGEIADYDRFLTHLRTGQEWRFRLTANPVRSLPPEDGKRGRIVPHVSAVQQLKWLTDRSMNHGFEILTDDDGHLQATVTSREDLRFTKRSDGGRTLTIRTATFDGMLRVINADQIRKSLRQGVGRSRAYGCGLLTLAHIHSR